MAFAMEGEDANSKLVEVVTVANVDDESLSPVLELYHSAILNGGQFLI